MRPCSTHRPHMYPHASPGVGNRGGRRVRQGSTDLAPLPLDSTPQNYRRQNGKHYKWMPILAQSALAGRVRKALRAGLPPLLLHRVAAKQHCANFAKHEILTKLFEIPEIRGKFREIQGKFCETRILKTVV